MAHITLSQLSTVLGRIVSWAGGKFPAKNANSGKLEYTDMPVVVLASMGEELDGESVSVSPDSTYFLPAGQGVGARILYRPESGNPVKISDPVSDVIYCNAHTNMLYRWNSTTNLMVPVGGDGDGLSKVYVGSQDFSNLDALHSAETSGVYQVIDQSSQRIIGILVVSSDNKSGSSPNFVTQWLFSNLSLSGNTGGYSGSIDGTHYTIGTAHIIHRFYNASTSTSDIPLNTWSDWKVYGLTSDEITTLLNTKANSSEVIKGISVNNIPQTKDQQGNVNINAVKSVTINGNTTQVDNNGNVNLGSVQGQKGDKGDTGNVEFEDLEDLVALLVNDLTTGGAGNFLSAEMGKRLKAKIDEVESNIQRLYNNLGNIAFWDATAKAAAAPIPIDWGNPKHNVTLDLSLTNAVVTNNGVAVSDGEIILVEEFSKLTLIVEPSSSSYELSSVTSSTTGAVVTNLLNGTYKVEITMGQSNVTLEISAVATGIPAQITFNVSNTNAAANALSISGNSVEHGGTYVGEISVVDNYFDGASIVSVKDGSNNDVPYTFSNNTITIANVPGDLTITAKATKQLKFYAGKGTTGGGGVSEQTGSCISDYIRLDGLNASSVLHWQHMFPKGTQATAQTQVIFFYSSDKKLLYFSENDASGWNPRRATNNQMQQDHYRDVTTTIIQGALDIAGQRLPLYARSAFLLTNDVPDAGIELTQGNKNFLDGHTFAEGTDLVVHTITYHNNGASCRSSSTINGTVARPNAIHGENFETLISVDSGLTLQSVVVTMGGVNISNDHPEWLANKKIVIDSVTGDLDITLTAS